VQGGKILEVPSQSAASARTPRRLLTVFCALVCCLAAAGCAAKVNGKGTHGSPTGSPASNSRSRSGTPTPTSTPPAKPIVWTHVVDPQSGIRFSMPGKAKVTTKPATAASGARRLYSVTVAQRFAVSVAIVEATAGRPFTAAALDGIATALRTQLTKTGVKDARILERRPATKGAVSELDFRLQFTAVDKKVGKSIWFVHAATDGDVLVLVQSIAFTPKPNAKLEKIIRAYQKQVATSLRLP
jgi:hypothetical protein